MIIAIIAILDVLMFIYLIASAVWWKFKINKGKTNEI